MTDQATITLSRPGSKSHPPQDITIPNQLGSVRLLSKIGEGGMGIVYRARDEILGRDVAVKFMTNALPTPDDPGFTAFLEGARSAAALQHPALTTVHQAGVVEGVPYIVMQLVDGPTVSELIKTTGPLNGHEALAILIAVAEAIAELHDRNIIHRDIKPSNVLLDPDGKIIVSDFGLAHRRRAGQSNQPSSGTPAYMAPEMSAGEVTPRTDVYALGIMGYELLAGKLPFRGDITQTLEQHRSTPLPLAELKDVLPEITDILERAAHKNTLFRHKSARQFARALAAVTDSKQIAQGRYSILQRITHRTGTPDVHPGLQSPTAPPVPTAPPAATTYFDHLSKIAASKRSHRPALEPPPLDKRARHCLHCGYNRHGLAESQLCPECGHIDDFAELQSRCASLARKPARFCLRILTFRAPPVGWWEVFDQPGIHNFTPLRTSFVLLLGLFVSLLVLTAINFLINNVVVHRTATAYLYKADDPQKKKVADYASGSETTSIFDRSPRGTYLKIPDKPVPGLASSVEWSERITILRQNPHRFLVFLPIVFLLGFSSWILYRYVWLNLLLYHRPDLSAAERAAVRRAAAPFSWIFMAVAVWLLVMFVIAIALHRFFPIGHSATVASIIALVFPPFVWARAITADRARRIFPNRALAAVVLLAALLAHILLFALFDQTANAMYRLILDQQRA